MKTATNFADFPNDFELDGKITLLQYSVLGLCFLIIMMDGFDILAMAYAAEPLSQSWDMPADRMGVVFSAGLLGMMIGALFLAPLSDKIGRRLMIIVCLFVAGLSTLLTGQSETLASLLFFRITTGLGIGCLMASATALTAEYSPEPLRNFIVCLVNAGYALGAVLGGFLAAEIIPTYGWQSVFYVGGLFTLLLAMAASVLLTESIEFLVSKQPKNALRKINAIRVRLNKSTFSELPSQKATGKDKASIIAVLSLLTPQHKSQTIFLWLTFFFSFITLYFLMSWIPKLTIDAGLPLEKGIYAGALLSLGGVVGILTLGFISIRFDLTRCITFFLALTAMFMILFSISTSYVSYLLIISFFIGAFMQGSFVGLYAVATRLYPAEIRATGVGWAIGLGRIGAVFGPYLAGLLIVAKLSVATCFLIFTIPLVFSIVMLLKLRVAIE